MSTARPFRLKGPFNVELYDDTPTLLFSESLEAGQDLAVKAEPQIDTDRKGVKRVTHSNVEGEYPLDEYDPADVAVLKDTTKAVFTFPNQGKILTIDNITSAYASMDNVMPKFIFGLVVPGDDWTTALVMSDVV